MGENTWSLPSADKIKHPVSLLAFSLTALVIVISRMTPNIYAEITSILVVGVISGFIIYKYESISNVESIKKDYEKLKNSQEQLELDSTNGKKLLDIMGIDTIPPEPTTLPSNLCLTNADQLNFWNEKIKPSLVGLGFEVEEHKRQDTPIGNTYFFTSSRYQDKDVAFIYLKNDYFLYGEKWQDSGWLSRLIPILRSNVIVVISDIDMLCYASLNEKEGIEATSDVKIMFIGKFMKNLFMRSPAKLFEDFIKTRVVDVYLQ